jgi:hypothetical protein
MEVPSSTPAPYAKALAVLDSLSFTGAESKGERARLSRKALQSSLTADEWRAIEPFVVSIEKEGVLLDYVDVVESPIGEELLRIAVLIDAVEVVDGIELPDFRRAALAVRSAQLARQSRQVEGDTRDEVLREHLSRMLESDGREAIAAEADQIERSLLNKSAEIRRGLKALALCSDAGYPEATALKQNLTVLLGHCFKLMEKADDYRRFLNARLVELPASRADDDPGIKEKRRAEAVVRLAKQAGSIDAYEQAFPTLYALAEAVYKADGSKDSTAYNLKDYLSARARKNMSPGELADLPRGKVRPADVLAWALKRTGTLRADVFGAEAGGR